MILQKHCISCCIFAYCMTDRVPVVVAAFVHAPRPNCVSVQVSADDYSERLHDQVSQRMDALAVRKRCIIVKQNQQAVAPAEATI